MSTEFETKYVHNVYQKIASHFDKTRYQQWNYVKLFLDSLPKWCVVLDNGCGNGKYLSYRDDITVIGTDICNELLYTASAKTKIGTIHANSLDLPFRSNMFDYSISIAVLHHFYEYENRIRYIEEMIRVTKPNGKILITVWAYEQEDSKVFKKWEAMDTKNDYFIPWCNTKGEIQSKRYYHLFDKQECIQLFSKIHNIFIIDIVFEKSNWCIIIQKL